MLDYKAKYKELRAKLIESTDVAYRLGFEEGMKEGQQAAMQQQMAMQQEMMAAQQGQVDPETGEPLPPEAQGGEMPPEAQGGEMPPEEMMGEEAGSELDQQIGELESLVAKGEKPTILAMAKKLEQKLPTEIIIFGIEVQDVKSLGEKCTPQVEAALDNILQSILDLL